jgi:hypothetical protein
VLGVPEGATDEEIRSAYRLLVNVWHPDRFAGDRALRDRVEEKLKIINEAYRGLKATGFCRPSGAAPARSHRRAPPPAEPLRVEVLVGTSGKAALQWKKGAPHPTLFGETQRITLAALLYGRALASHEESRTAVLLAMEIACGELEWGRSPEGPMVLPGRVGRQVWPLEWVPPEEAEGGARLVATLEGVALPRVRIACATGSPGVLLVGALLPVLALPSELHPGDRHLLGRVLREVNAYFSLPSERFAEGNEVFALARALPLLSALA